MSNEDSLDLNEALISVDKSSISEPLQVFYQTEECFGCKLEKLADLKESSESFRVETNYGLKLELQNQDNVSCQLNNLALNSQAHYRIRVTTIGSNATRALDCKLVIVENGECLVCPFAILVSILFAFVALEWAYLKFVKARRQKRPPPVDGGETVSGDEAPPTGQSGASVAAANLSESIQEIKRDDVTNRLAATADHPSTSPDGVRAASRRRADCLDAFRGLTIAGMIFVNYGGAGYAIWEHKPWNGITLADFVFPFFIFSMGASIAISMKSTIKRRERRRESFYCILWKILRRSFNLMALGLCLNSKWLDFDHGDGLKDLRLTGVLQRFSLSYLIVALMYAVELTLAQWLRAQSLSRVPYLSRFVGAVLELLLGVHFLAIYIFVTFFVPYDANCPLGYTGPGGWTEGAKYANCTGGAAAWLDRLVLGTNHLYNSREIKQVFHSKVSHDPEGILGYTTSIVLTLIGLQCGKILTMKRECTNSTTQHRSRLAAFTFWIVVLAASCPLVVIIPINKRLWSLTFVIVAALAAFILITSLYAILDIYKCTQSFLIRLLISAGKNSIFLYVGHSLIYNLLPWWVPISDPSSHLQLLLRLSWSVFVWLLAAHLMATKNLYIRI